MKEEFRTYLQEIGMGTPFQESVSQLISLYSQLTEESVDKIFVSEYVDQDGTRHYENLILLTKNLVFETEHFLTEPKMWAARYHNNVSNLEMTFTDYDFRSATSTSRLSCTFRWDPGDFMLPLKASGGNCDQLKELAKTLVSQI